MKGEFIGRPSIGLITAEVSDLYCNIALKIQKRPQWKPEPPKLTYE
jgi:hypothetical protein